MELLYCAACKRETQHTSASVKDATLINHYFRCSICFNLTVREKEKKDMLIILRTRFGTYMGTIKNSVRHVLYQPCMLEFITVPVQGRVGQQSMATLRSVVAWPERILEFPDLTDYAFSVIEDLNSEMPRLYYKTIEEAWPKSKIN